MKKIESTFVYKEVKKAVKETAKSVGNVADRVANKTHESIQTQLKEPKLTVSNES